jgi:hypothetical protein
MSKPLFSLRPKPEVAEIIKTMAAEDRRPVSQFLANLVEDAIAQRQDPKSGAQQSERTFS